MGKTKGGRVMNPTDAERKKARQKEITRNKLERTMQRSTPKDPEVIKDLLGDLITEEEAEKAKGKVISQELRLRRKVLQDAMKIAVVKEKVRLLMAWLYSRVVHESGQGHPCDSSVQVCVHNIKNAVKTTAAFMRSEKRVAV